MNPYEALQDLVDQVPTIVQPLVVALAGMVPYIEGEGSAALGVLAGIHPVVAALAGATGNILAVFVVVHFGDRLRTAFMSRRARKAAVGSPVEVLVGSGGGGTDPTDLEDPTEPEDPTRSSAPAAPKPSKGRARLQRWVVRFGVPGASLIAPLALPTHLTAATLVASGVARSWVLLWQFIAIVLWTTVITLAATGVLSVVVG
ncbi:small multidrug efflux protein [Brachybacterium tyrofermentans]|uniref:small multidrug efflux protein n=1 Tax=Brachybacterium tyrofermentans TaxID=47848 RepID=UPI003FD5ACA8